MILNRANWDQNSYEAFVKHIKEFQDIGYREFNKKLIPGEEHIIGIRMPILRKLSKEITYGNWRQFLDVCRYTYHEELLIQAIIISSIKCEFTEIEEYIVGFVPKIRNWSICDSFCSGLKITISNKEIVYELVKKYLYTDCLWQVRFAIVMLLEYYIEEDYLKDIFYFCDDLDSNEYYVQMAVAWLISMCYVKFEQETLKYLISNDLDNFTYNKALQKIIESNRVDIGKKNIIKNMKRKNRN